MKINRNTLQVSQATYDRGKELFQEGSISKADLAQLESQVSSDKYQLVTSESSLRDYKLHWLIPVLSAFLQQKKEKAQWQVYVLKGNKSLCLDRKRHS